MNILKDFYFEKVSNCDGAIIPTRGTKDSAGYDFYALEDIVIPSYTTINDKWMKQISGLSWQATPIINSPKKDWNDVEDFIKKTKTKTTLIPTGIKCHLPEGYYLHLSLRSSTPHKHWLIIANAPGIVDADYYNNPDNEGHIFFQIINLSPADIVLHKGDKIGQGIILPYFLAEGDMAAAARTGGFGSTSK